MRTTIDLPDELFRKVKAAAALEGVKLKDLIARLIENGLRQGQRQERRGKRPPLPELIPATGRVIPLFSSAEIDAILFGDEDEKD
jgi:hypothetical protein